jgi:radical SAM superfamily enzyme YgiQ (UPF0313 family)
MADILFVNPPFRNGNSFDPDSVAPFFPLGLLYVAAVAREVGYDVSIFDGAFMQGDGEFIRALEEEAPRVVALGASVGSRASSLRLAKLAKERGATVLAGGAHPTTHPERYLLSAGIESPVDVVTVGEAEETLVELLPLLMAGEHGPSSLEGVLGVAYRDGVGRVVRTPHRPLIDDLDRLPLPARDLVDWEPYLALGWARSGAFPLSLLTSRGCPHACAWCEKEVFGRSHRTRSPESVAEEMLLLKEEYRPDFLRVVDDVLGVDREWVKAWRDAVLERGAVVPFECRSRVELIDEEVAGWLKDAGCVRIACSAESGSQRVLDAMKKEFNVGDILHCAEACREQGIELYLYMMVGYPGETWQDLKLSARMLRKARPTAFWATLALPQAGSPFYELVDEQLPEAVEKLPDRVPALSLLFDQDSRRVAFYRQVLCWLHQEWQDALHSTGEAGSLWDRVSTRAHLWRDRLLLEATVRATNGQLFPKGEVLRGQRAQGA